ncbi:MAG: hypothetical protein ACFFCO_11520 [Promethearchaeota archaeon]
MVEILLLLSVFIIGLVIRYLPHIRYYLPGTSDMFYHFSKICNPAHGEEKMVYPPLFHWIFRIFRRSDGSLPERGLTRLMPMFDIGTALILYLFLRGTFTVESALIAALLFLVTPAVVIQGITFSPRPLGLLFFVSSLLCLTLPFPFNYLTILPIALTLLTHRLATQTLFFIFLGLTFTNWPFGVLFIGGVGLALLLSRGQYYAVLRSHLVFIKRYITGTRVPNRRLLGIILTPTLVSLICYIVLQLLSYFVPFPLSFCGLLIWQLPILLPNIVILFLVWSITCLLLLIFWFAGESYRYTYYAGAPFAFFCAFLLQSSTFFLFLSIILLGVGVALSAYFSFRTQHLDRDVVALLRFVGKIKKRTYLLVPYSLLRAARYFSKKESTFMKLLETTSEQASSRIKEEKITHVIVGSTHLGWFPDLERIKQIGDWYLLKV